MRDVSLLSLVGLSGPPRTIGELERVLGLRLAESDVASSSLGQLALHAISDAPPVTSVSATYAWDMFHERPVATVAALRERKILSFTVAVAEGLGAIERALAESAVGRELRPDRGRVYGHWVVRSNRDAGTLAHYDELPDWAVPEPDAGARARALIDLFARAEAATDFSALARASSIALDSTGIALRAVESLPNRLDIDFAPAMPACEIARALGWSEVASRSRDVHQTEWLVDQVVRTSGDVVLSSPVIGCWVVRARLDRRPTGGPLEVRGPTPPGGIHRIAPADVVRKMWLTSRS